MKRILLAFILFVLACPAAQAANSTVSAMTAASALGGTELLYVVQGGTDRKGTPLQIAAYVYGLMSGDATAAAGGALTLATVNANVGSFGSATNCVSFTTNAKGLITAASATTCTPAIASVTGLGTGVASALAAALNSSTGLIGALTPTNNNCVVGNGSAWTSAACPGGGGAVSSVSGGIGVTVSPTTGAVVVSSPVTTRNNSTTSDTITSSDKGTVVTENNASSVAVAITTAGFVSSDYFTVKNLGAGVATYTPSAGNIDGAGTLVCSQNQSADLYFDGTNYKSLSKTCGLGTASTANTGTSGHVLPFLDGSNTFSGAQTFGEVIGTVTSQSGTTYTFAATDCGTTVRFTNAAAVTATIPQGLPVGCSIAVEQTTAAGQVAVNGSAVTPATLHSAHSYTKTFGQWAIIGIFTESSNVAILTGDGA